MVSRYLRAALAGMRDPEPFGLRHARIAESLHASSTLAADRKIFAGACPGRRAWRAWPGRRFGPAFAAADDPEAAFSSLAGIAEGSGLITALGADRIIFHGAHCRLGTRRTWPDRRLGPAFTAADDSEAALASLAGVGEGSDLAAMLSADRIVFHSAHCRLGTRRGRS